MFPGFTTRLSSKTVASAATLDADKDLLVLTGSTALVTLNPKTPNKAGMAQIVFIIPTSGALATTTAGNMVAVVSMLQNTVTMWVWNPATSKWYPHALA